MIRQVALNAVDVTFAQLPQIIDRTLSHDALRAANWTLYVVLPFGSAVRLPQWVVQRDVYTVRIYFDGELTPSTTYELDGAGIYAASGIPLAALFGHFASLKPEQALSKPAQQAPYDIANPSLRGTYQITETGDYENDSQWEALKKRITRRATTGQGGFFHLPDYGFAPSGKGTITTGLLRRLQAQALAQVQREPEVLTASVAVSQSPTAPQIVTLWIRARTRGGDQDPFSVTVNLGS